MLFNSYIFILAFLPVTLVGYFLLGKMHRRAALLWLLCASLFFYGWCNPRFVALILVSIACNYAFGRWLTHLRRSGSRSSGPVLAAGVTFDLGVLCYFKYAAFLVANANSVLGLSLAQPSIILPVALSFYTFIQIAYLVDAYRGQAPRYSLLDYATSVTFFPHLISGPIVYHRELIPQYHKPGTFAFNYENFAIGITIFLIGLFQKVALADTVSGIADTVFEAAGLGISLTFSEAWIGALSYTFQIYFDFCGYSNMAIGLARMLNIWYPVNFASPYKATSVIDFWRRWHITLSRFIRDYLYIPLGGNRKGPFRQYVNLMIAMSLIGLWHGAGWTFVLWGATHGLYLVINHLWRRLAAVTRLGRLHASALTVWSGRVLTFILVALAWVLFRAASFSDAWAMLRPMMSLPLTNGLLERLGILGQTLSQHGFVSAGGVVNLQFSIEGGVTGVILLLLCCLAICWFLPNVQEYMALYKPTLEHTSTEYRPPFTRIRWQPTLLHFAFVLALAFSTLGFLDVVHEFIYYQF